MRLKSIILLSFATLFLFACHKDEGPAALKPTQSGQNIIAFTVNGQQHVYTGVPTYFTGGITFNVTKTADSSMMVNMSGSVHNYKDGFNFIVNIPNFSLSDVFYIGNNYPYYQSYYNFENNNGIVDVFHPDSSKSSFIFTRLDSLVGAGTFQFYGIDNDGNTIALTNGFFDIANPFN